MRCIEHCCERAVLGIVLTDDNPWHSVHNFRKCFAFLLESYFLVLSLHFFLQSKQGNLKAAITADVIQGITMIIVSFGVIAQGAYEAGGVERAVKINSEHGRLDFFTLSGDITTRIDTLSAWLGQLFISLSVLGCQQNNVQRYMSMKSQKDVTRYAYNILHLFIQCKIGLNCSFLVIAH